MMGTKQFSIQLKQKMQDLGFSSVGFAKAEALTEDLAFFKTWMAKGFHAGKAYLERNPELRANPILMMPETKSVISGLISYYTAETLPESQYYKISRYAYGKDYHTVINAKLKQVVDYIAEQTSNKNTRAFVDSSPIFEKAWAKHAGLGWIGKNTLLLNQTTGSFHFIGTIITDIELEYNAPQAEKCGSCTKCLDACPTQALSPYEIDVRKCITHLLEQKNEIPAELKSKLNNYIYACDICQEACPWNQDLQPTTVADFQISSSLLQMKKEDWEQLTEEKFTELFQNSAIERIKYAGLKRNIDFVRED